MRDIFFISQPSTYTDSIYVQLEEIFHTKKFDYDWETLRNEVENSKPVIIMAYVTNTTDKEKLILREVSKLLSQNVIFIIFGGKEDCKTVKIESAKYLATPFSVGQFIAHLATLQGKLYYFEETIKNQEKLDEIAEEFDPHRKKVHLEKAPEPKALKHILVVDDNVTLLRTMMNWLKGLYKVSVVKSGPQALSFLDKEIPDLILLDYEMPDMDGPATLKHIREIEELQKVPVVFLTGVNDQEMIKTALSFKPDGYVLKSGGQVPLFTKINEIFGEK